MPTFILDVLLLTGITFGLLSALAWGLAGLVGTNATRLLGTNRTMAWSTIAGFAVTVGELFEGV